MLFARVWLVLGSFSLLNPVLAQESGEASLNSEGSLSVTSSVSRAQVYVDYELVGQVPHTQVLSPGAHNLRVTAEKILQCVIQISFPCV